MSVPTQPIQPSVEEGLILRDSICSFVMTIETKPVVALYINLLVRVDIEKAYKLGLEVAKDNNALFQGILPWAIVNRDIEYLFFIADVDSMNKIIEKIKLGLNLTEENLLYTVTPSVRPKEKPPTINHDDLINFRMTCILNQS